MPDRPILFSAPMIRALLDGRKTQTRRVIHPHEPAPLVSAGDKPASNVVFTKIPARHGGFMQGPSFKLPYAPGDRLWVRECAGWLSGHGWQYRADAKDLEEYYETGCMGRWRPSIHMPRRASRITLTVTDARVQRLQDISEADAIAEGCRPFFDHDNQAEHVGPNGTVHQMAPLRGPQDDFHRLWDSLNAARAPSDSNPWVVVLTFTVQRGNIDQEHPHA